MCNAHTRTLANSRTQKKQTAECMCGNAWGEEVRGGSAFHCFVMPLSLALSFAFFLFALRPLCYFCSHLLIYQGTRAQKNATKNVSVFCICSCCNIWCNSSKECVAYGCLNSATRSLAVPLFQYRVRSLSLSLLVHLLGNQSAKLQAHLI